MVNNLYALQNFLLIFCAMQHNYGVTAKQWPDRGQAARRASAKGK
jgi:hypothetical protein